MMLEVNALNLSVEQKKIIQEVNFSLEKGEFVALIGPNGSGKSSVIKVISRIITKHTGQVVLMGKLHEKYKAKEFAKKIATMFQHNQAPEGLTVYDIIAYGRTPHKSMFSSLTSEDHEVIEKYICAAGLTSLKDKKLDNLSGGELQRVYLIACLVQEPAILILDEPTNHLDILHQYRLLSLIKEQSVTNNISVICVIHDINQAIKYADRLLIMKDGCLRYNGHAKDIITEELIMEIYGINSKVYKDENGIHVDFMYA